MSRSFLFVRAGAVSYLLEVATGVPEGVVGRGGGRPHDGPAGQVASSAALSVDVRWAMSRQADSRHSRTTGLEVCPARACRASSTSSGPRGEGESGDLGMALSLVSL